MQRADVFDRLTKIFQDVFNDKNIILGDATTAKDVKDWDSLATISLISEIEYQFSVKFSMKAVQGMKSVGEMVGIILQELDSRTKHNN